VNTTVPATDPLRSRLKHLVADLFRLDLPDPETIADEEALIGSKLGLDSLDALQLAISVEEEFGITIANNHESGSAFASIASLAAFIRDRTRAGAGTLPTAALA